MSSGAQSSVGSAINDDFTRNLRRFVAEERISLATTRPAAVNVINGLPTAA
jgi:hypothetical protein